MVGEHLLASHFLNGRRKEESNPRVTAFSDGGDVLC